jgi:mRNA-degrading endonuclease RelE of RelBE toxin-antitoxin system
VKEKYRVVYRVDEEEKEVRLVAFGHRKDIYKLMMFLRVE